MIKNKKAFTMVELIFVIVIIGILAAVAVPRLSVTRDDAKIATTVSNLKVLLYDAFSFYASQGDAIWKVSKWSDVTDSVDSTQGATATLNSPVKIYGEYGVACFTITPSSDANGTVLTVTANNSTDVICSKAQEVAKKDGVVDNSYGKTLQLGGQSISF